MLFARVIFKSCEYASAYFRILRKAGFQLLLANMATRSQLGRFYWVSLLMTAAAISIMFWLSNVLYAAEPQRANLKACYPDKPMPLLSFFVLAECAAFILLIGAKLESIIITKIWPSLPPVTASNQTQIITRRLHELMWGWFPVWLFLTILISQNYLRGLLDDCSKGNPINVVLIAKEIWPGFVIAYLIVILANWLIYKWKPDMELGFILGCTFLLYAVVIAIVSPADALFLVRFCRNLPANLESSLNFFLGRA
jgi:hypothetical protein